MKYQALFAFVLKQQNLKNTHITLGSLKGFTLVYDSLCTVMSPYIARPLTLRTSPNDYATFNQIKSFLIFSIRLLLEREKTAKGFHFNLSLLSRGGFR